MNERRRTNVSPEGQRNQPRNLNEEKPVDERRTTGGFRAGGDMPTGWLAPERRTSEMNEVHRAFLAETPAVGVEGPIGSPPPKMTAWEIADQAPGMESFRRDGRFKNIRQITGSCVGFAMANEIFYQTATEALYFGEPERILFPFFGYPYGLGRLEAGIRGRGEGSTGSGQAKAIAKYGVLAFDHQGAPAPRLDDSIQWDEATEFAWSDGEGPAQRYLEEGRKHVVKKVTRAVDVDQAVELMANGYWGTTASDWGGKLQCPTIDGALLNTRVGVWHHQQWVAGYWVHPRLGRLFAIGNQWGYVHGVDPPRRVDESTPSAAPPGVYWVNERDFSYMLSAGETFFYSGLEGFPSRPSLYWMI
jgi:hypothetical protein